MMMNNLRILRNLRWIGIIRTLDLKIPNSLYLLNLGSIETPLKLYYIILYTCNDWLMRYSTMHVTNMNFGCEARTHKGLS